MIEYLSKIETEFENTLICLSGARLGFNHEKNGCRKFRDTLPLIFFLSSFCVLPEVSKTYDCWRVQKSNKNAIQIL